MITHVICEANCKQYKYTSTKHMKTVGMGVYFFHSTEFLTQPDPTRPDRANL